MLQKYLDMRRAACALEDQERTGIEVIRASNLGAARGWSALALAEQLGFIESRWANSRWPRKRLYRVTPKGIGKLGLAA